MVYFLFNITFASFDLLKLFASSQRCEVADNISFAKLLYRSFL